MPGRLDSIPKFRDQFRVEILGPALTFLIGEQQCFALSGKRNVRVAEEIDGRRSSRQIMQHLCGELPEPQVLYTISHFRERGYLEPDPPPGQPIARAALGESESDELRASLERVSAELSANAGITLVATDDYLNPGPLACDAKRWLLIKPTGVPLVGPLFDGNDGPCPECLAFWIRKNRPVEEFVRRRRELS